MIAPTEPTKTPSERRIDSSTDGRTDTHSQSMHSNLSSITADLAKLTELQRRLAVLECQAVARTVAPVIVQLVVGTVMTLAALPLLLTAIAEQLQMMTNLSAAASEAMVGGSVALISVVLVLFAFRSLRRMPPPFLRSSRQWAENLQWLTRNLGASRR